MDWSPNGDTLRPVDNLIQSSGWKRFRGWFGWHQLTETRLQNGLDNIRSWYPKHDHLLAQVTLVNLDYHSDANTVTPVLAINPGPPVLVRLRGAKLSSGKLRSLLPIYEERSVDRDLLEEGSRDLASYFQTPRIFRRHSRLPNGHARQRRATDRLPRRPRRPAQNRRSSKSTAITISTTPPSASACP